MQIITEKRRAGFGRIGLILLLPFLILTLAYGAYQIFFVPDPVISGLEGLDLLPAEKTVTLNTENVRNIDITIYQNGKEINLISDTPVTGEKVYTLEIKPKDLGLTDGRAVTTIKAKSGILKKVQYDRESVIDTIPPSLQVVGAPSLVYQGSAGFSVLRAAGEESVFIKLIDRDRPEQDRLFRAFRLRAASDGNNRSPENRQAEQGTKVQGHPAGTLYYAFFPAPFEISDGSLFYAVARDAAGNQSVQALPSALKMQKFRSSVITIDDAFLNRVISPLLNITDIADPVGAFRKVNEDWRQESLQRLLELSEETEPDILWHDRFLQLRNSKVMAIYGDRRTYRYRGMNISKAVHLGYDLASYANAPVEAANAGVVRFADNLSIYGNTVIIDHGLGLMSLYGHLFSITVSPGEKVAKGQTVGVSGSTGLAGGDHLHFGILVHGYEVSPLYWWDQDWIDNNVGAFLEQ